MTDDELAALFHAEYERLAPEFGYKTRDASAVPWEQVPENNRRLMVAVAGSVKAKVDAEVVRLGGVIDEYREVIELHHADFVKIKEITTLGLRQSKHVVSSAVTALTAIDKIVR